jgi:predicted AlkP superfamily pyrophosphatase or phosphodiesterase
MRTAPFRRLSVIVFALVFSAHAQPHPKLIVVVVVDQMRADYLARFAAYEKGGFHFFTTKGATFLNAYYEHLPTETCPGHSALISGRNPVHTGIVANDWYDKQSGKMTYCVEDASSPLIGESGAAVSPKNLVGDNFSDWLESSYPGARVFSISLKDRAAILMGGHRPQGVFWFSRETGRFVTSHFYAGEVPNWTEEFNHKNVVESYAGKQWVPMLGGDSPAYHKNQVPGLFPHAMPEQPGRELNEAVYGSPFGDEILEDLAEAAAKANHLGENHRGAPDMLAIGFSSNDAIGHAYGPDSPEMADEQIRLDRTLDRLVQTLSAELGGDKILWVLSADHGVEPTPEAELQLRRNKAARRIAFSQALQSVETQLDTIFKISGEMRWFAAESDAMLYFDRAELARHNISVAAATKALTTQVHGVPGVDAFYGVTQLDSVRNWIGPVLRNSAFPARSGDVYYLTSQWTLFSSKATGTSHGDPWPYDTHVPLLLAGWHIEAQRIAENVHVVDLAPTLADLTGVHPPSSEVLDGKSRKNLLKLNSARPQ